MARLCESGKQRPTYMHAPATQCCHLGGMAESYRSGPVDGVVGGDGEPRASNATTQTPSHDNDCIDATITLLQRCNVTFLVPLLKIII